MVRSDEHLQVFVSSVMASEDLTVERASAEEAVRSITLTSPWTFERAPAEPRPAQAVYLREVANSDLFVLLVSRTHSDAVQRELEAAEAQRVPILAFVRALPDVEKATPERQAVISWLSPRVKYRMFADIQDLREAVVVALVAELVRGYRKFRLTDADFRTLVARVETSPSLIVRPPEAAEMSEVEPVLRDLERWYPSIGPWITRVVDEGRDHADVRVAKVDGRIAAVSVARDKDEGVRKFSTLFVRPEFQGTAIGPHLIQSEIVRAARDNVRKAYVTLADELLEQLGPILERYGFVAEGASAERYRPGAAEWVFGRRFVRRTLTPATFPRFVRETMFTAAGCTVVEASPGALLRVNIPRQALFGIGKSNQIAVVVSTSTTPESDYERAAESLDGEDWVLISIMGKPANRSHWSHKVVNWIDGEEIRARFYPVVLQNETPGIICTIKPGFANGLIPSPRQASLFQLTRVQIRPDNAYYRAPTHHGSLRRGSPIFFYVSAPEMAIRGHGFIQETLVDEPSGLLAQFGTRGIFEYEDLLSVASRHGGRALAIAFDWYTPYVSQFRLSALRAVVPGYTPQSARVVDSRTAARLRQEMVRV